MSATFDDLFDQVDSTSREVQASARKDILALLFGKDTKKDENIEMFMMNLIKKPTLSNLLDDIQQHPSFGAYMSIFNSMCFKIFQRLALDQIK